MGDTIKPPDPAANLQTVTRRDRSMLTEDCKAFLRVQIPESNIVSYNKFHKYFALFNKEAIAKLSESEQKRLYEQYCRTFSLQHPIKIYGRSVEDPEEYKGDVVYVAEDRSYHEVMHTIPPMFRQLRTLNELGSGVAAGLINSFLNNAIKSDNPSAQVEYEKYGYVIGRLIEAINPPDNKAEAEYADAEKALVSGESGSEAPKKSQSNPDAMTDLFDW